jgi:hypothetical protein
MEIVKNNQVEMLEIEILINQIQTTMDSIIRIKQKKAYQRWRTRLRSYCIKQSLNKLMPMNATFKNSRT